MDELPAVIHAAIQSDDSITRESVRQWIAEARDVGTLALLYQLTNEAWDRIHPQLEAAETCLLIRRYLLRCIHDDPQDDDFALTRQQAAGELEVWFDHLASKEDTKVILQDVVAEVTDLFLNGDQGVRNAIETGFLEHILEQASLRSWFSHWSNDKRLNDTWQRALAWGEAHPNYMKGLREQLRRLQLHDERSS
jgi:hypothetical protein